MKRIESFCDWNLKISGKRENGAVDWWWWTKVTKQLLYSFVMSFFPPWFSSIWQLYFIFTTYSLFNWEYDTVNNAISIMIFIFLIWRGTQRASSLYGGEHREWTSLWTLRDNNRARRLGPLDSKKAQICLAWGSARTPHLGSGQSLSKSVWLVGSGQPSMYLILKKNKN